MSKTLPAARILGVSHRYKQIQALNNISLAIPAGQMVGLLGPDGVGKSTLLGLLSGARRLQQGTLNVLGEDISDSQARKVIGPRIAYMPQGLGKNLYQELSIAENLNFFASLFGQSRQECAQRIERLTRATGLHPFLDRPASKLSGGMKQKLGLCCSLIHDPDFLLLDEPTTGVDPLSRRQFWELLDSIRSERENMSIIVSTAYMDEAERFDWLVAMDDGCILDTGTPAELKARTSSRNLEAAFIQLLPKEKRERSVTLDIPPLDTTDQTPAISAKALTRTFGDFTAVDSVSFEIQRGEIFGFLGSNGCGKTTTMKMLTGLLPASEGEAFLFGHPVNAGDLETRKRVGFMTQAFSLYGDLTIKQNLNLHARLFHMPAEQAERRIRSLAERFDLTAHLNHKASSLPLGMRQRLSLAVAVIHEPEMLILDEPTSGVDPVARDEFWQLLVELSRRDKVTIFISTHFMNEALRCDRISLMHAGKVLVCDEPAQLVVAKGAENLESAFISYIEEATPAPPAEPQPRIASDDIPVQPLQHKPLHQFSLRRLLAISYRELMEVLRDPVRLAFAFLGSSILLLVLAYGISLDVENLTYAVLDQDQTVRSREYLNNFVGSRYFLEQPEIVNKAELEARMKASDISLAIEIPPGFGRELISGNSPEVSAWIDGANTTRAATIEGYVSGVHSEYISLLMREAGYDSDDLLKATVESRYRYNPSFESIYSIGPKASGMLLLLFPAILMAISMAREKEIGTITNFYVTPTSRLEFLLGKQLPYILIGTLNFLILTLLVVLVLQVPLKGSFAVLLCGAVLYSVAVTGFGLMVSSATRTQVAAIFAATVLSMMPTVQFSGMIQPVSTLDGAGRIVGTIWPATYYNHLSVGAFTKGLSFGDLYSDLVILSLFGPVFLCASALLLRKQEA